MNARVDFPQTTLSAAERADRPRDRWTIDRVTALFLAALAPPLAASLHESGGGLLPLLAGSLATAGFWVALFARMRGRPVNWHFLVTAIVFALLVPPAVPLWQALLAISFGVVIGEQVFGGRGYSFLHPAAAALAFLFFSFPASTTEQASSLLVAIAVLPGAALLVAGRLVAWRVLAGFAAGLALWLALKGFPLPWQAVATSSLALGLVFLVCEPVGAAATNPGRWAYGILAGMLVVILGEAGAGAGSPSAIVFSALLASIFAPLIDRVAILVNVNRRRRRKWPT